MFITDVKNCRTAEPEDFPAAKLYLGVELKLKSINNMVFTLNCRNVSLDFSSTVYYEGFRPGD